MSDINALLENAGVCGFHPVQCTQKTLDSLPSSEGYVYFTTDTKKIYLGKSNGKLDMCAHTGIFYGTKDIKYVNNGLAPDPNVSFIKGEIEGSDWPEVNDLILNKDGCFYRVKNINTETGQISTERLTLQGTGSGGSGGGGGSSDGGAYNIGFSNISKSYTFSSVSDQMMVGVVGYRSNTTDNYISSISFSSGVTSYPPFT